MKHESFEHYLSDIKAKCKGKHQPDQKCQNCLPDQSFSYKMDLTCRNHRPYPEGSCTKCRP